MQTAIGPRQRVQSLSRNLIGAGNTYAVGTLSNSAERCFNLSNQSSALASLLEQELLCEAADGLVAGVLWSINL